MGLIFECFDVGSRVPAFKWRFFSTHTIWVLSYKHPDGQVCLLNGQYIIYNESFGPIKINKIKVHWAKKNKALVTSPHLQQAIKEE